MQTILLKQTFTWWLQITLIENNRIVSENDEIAKTFNTYFESVIDSLNHFERIGESVNSTDKIEQIIVKFLKHPSILNPIQYAGDYQIFLCNFCKRGN